MSEVSRRLPGLAGDLLRMPSAQRFQSGILEDIRRRVCVIAELPRPSYLQEVSASLLASWDRAGLRVWHLDDARRLPEEPVGLFFAREGRIGQNKSNEQALEHMLAGRNPAVDVICVSSSATPSRWCDKEWPFFIDAWTRVSARLGEDSIRRPAVCLIAGPAEFPFDSTASTPILTSHRWCDIPSLAEMRVACRFAGRRSDGAAKLAWREQILPPLTGSDLAAVEALWEVATQGLERVLEVLEDYALARGWTPDLLAGRGVMTIDESLRQSVDWRARSLPKEITDLWADGLLVASGEGGLCVHSAAAASLGQVDRIRHRLWKGQISLLLPLVDSIRLAVCEHLTARHGSGWPLLDSELTPQNQQQLAALRESPLACEFGYLQVLLRHSRQFREDAKQLGSIVTLCRSVRNELSHYRPVEFSDYEGLIRELDAASRVGLVLSVAGEAY